MVPLDLIGAMCSPTVGGGTLGSGSWGGDTQVSNMENLKLCLKLLCLMGNNTHDSHQTVVNIIGHGCEIFY